MPFKLGIEVDFDVEFFIFLGDNNAVHQQAEVGVADGSFLMICSIKSTLSFISAFRFLIVAL